MKNMQINIMVSKRF